MQCTYCDASFVNRKAFGPADKLTRTAHLQSALQRLKQYTNKGQSPPEPLRGHVNRLYGYEAIPRKAY